MLGCASARGCRMMMLGALHRLWGKGSKQLRRSKLLGYLDHSKARSFAGCPPQPTADGRSLRFGCAVSSRQGRLAEPDGPPHRDSAFEASSQQRRKLRTCALFMVLFARVPCRQRARFGGDKGTGSRGDPYILGGADPGHA